MKAIGKLVFCGMLAATASGQAQAITPDKMDIVGLKIGMTEAEVMRALKAYDGGAQVIARRMAHFPYSDGVSGFNTPPFLDEIEVRAGDSRFRVWFASAPAESRAYAIQRYAQGVKNPPSRQQFLAALAAKYGPGQSYYDASRGANISQWGEQGKPECAVSSNATGRILVDGANDTLLPPNAADNLEALARRQHPNLRRGMPNGVDVARCGAVLRYTWGGSQADPTVPVPEYYAWLVDQGGMVAKSRQSDEWVKRLAAEAARKRQGQAVAPRL